MSHTKILFLDADIRQLWFGQSKSAISDALKASFNFVKG